jgi:hypothetical protein
VCQLDELQRLKSERSIVRNALATLPKDLDETYERVFLRIPKEEWSFVCHVFYWFCFYRELDLHQDGLPCMLLLDAARTSTLRTGHSTDNRYYDSERLKELCGCLIVLQQGVSESDTLITFAHYTVKEYLDSTRILQSPTSSFSTQMSTISPICLDVVFFQAQSITYSDVVRLKQYTRFRGSDDWRYLAQVFPLHCAFSALHSMRERDLSLEICANESLFGLMKSLLKPSGQYFKWLSDCIIGINENELWPPLGEYKDEHEATTVWTVVWEESATGTEAALLLSLLLISDYTICPLTMKILGEVDLNILLRRKVVLQKRMKIVEKHDSDVIWTATADDYTFSGSVIEVMSQFVGHSSGKFRFLLKSYPGFYDPSTTLLHFIGHHGVTGTDRYSCDNDHNSDCPVRTLLEAGAEPNPSGYRVTPLQIAVAAWDLEGVQLLLEYGADPEGTGDPNGLIWPHTSPKFRFNGLHGKSPLQICRTRECFHHVKNDIRIERAPALEQIEWLLLQGRRNLSSAR